MHDLTRHARRAIYGRTVLDALAGTFLCCSAAFWLMLHWVALVGPSLPTLATAPQAVVAVVMTIIYALALPLLLSMLVPTTPAGQLLQKTQWRTVGFPVIIASVGLLGYWAVKLIRSWFAAQATIADAGIDPGYVIAAIVGFVVIPALAWVQVSPERWLREIEQAHQVKKLELMQRGELAIVKARLLWAEQKAAVSYAKLLPAEQQEVRDTLRGLLMGIADTQRSIARTMGVSADIERQIMGDAEIADSLDYVARQLERPAQSMERSLTWIDGQGRETWLADAEGVKVAHVDSRSQSSETREAQSAPVGPSRPHADPDSDKEYTIVIDCIHKPVWVAQDVADILRIDKTTAQKKCRAWLAQGWIDETRLGHYRIVVDRTRYA